MSKFALLLLTVLALAAADWQTASAQFPKIPKIPKPAKPKPDTAAQPSADAGTTSSSSPQPTPPASPSSHAASANTAEGDDQPTLNKNSLVVETAQTNRMSDDSYGWLPQLTFNVNGPIASGNQLYAEFSQPTGGTWVKFDCKTWAKAKGESLFVERCGGRELPQDKGATYTGPVNFSIKMRNELAGTDVTLFTGRAKVGKFPSGDGPKKFYYYVDQDWRLPLGYVFLWADDAVARWDFPQLRFGFWIRGELEGSVQPHLFYQGKEVAPHTSCSADGQPGSYGKAYAWKSVTCEFSDARAWDKGDNRKIHPDTYLFSEHPGDYEIKVLWHGHLARSIKFSVDPTGNIIDTGVAKANRLGTRFIIVPAQILGNEDGNWDHNAWKTEAYYGNPPTGFSAPPQ